MGFQEWLDDKEGRGRPPARADHEGKGQVYTPPPSEKPLSMKPIFMKARDAIRIVLDLANLNTLTDERTQGDPDLVLEMEKQQAAIGVIEDFFCNVVAEDRLVDLKEVLMKLGNALVQKHGFSPPAPISPEVLQSTTNAVATMTEWLNAHEEAREVLKNLGFEWSMPS